MAHFSPPLYLRRNQFCGRVGPGSAAFIMVSMCGHWPRAVTIEISLRSGCGKSHEAVIIQVHTGLWDDVRVEKLVPPRAVDGLVHYNTAVHPWM